MPILATGNFLVHLPRLTLDGSALAGLPATLSPLYPDERASGGMDRAGRPSEWFLYSPPSEQALPGDEHPWDAAHSIAKALEGTLRNSGAGELTRRPYVEPDLIHRRYLRIPESVPMRAADGQPWPAGNGLSPNYPPYPDEHFSAAWHLEYGRFKDAWKESSGAGARIAHLDTGYFPAHCSTPRHMHPEQGYNYYDGNGNVFDPGTELLAGHGTATLALLAGKEVDLIYQDKHSAVTHRYRGIIGGAPEADIVPVRIGGIFGSVVHLKSSSMAQGLHHALGTAQRAPCDVVSLSHGGLPSKAWVHEINRLYEAGIVIAAAAGDSFYAVVLDIATRFTVYPSAWWRVITVTGETYSKGPYTTDHFGVMQGCWGPSALMRKSLGAYTPNVPWMRLGLPTAWDMDGGGTSASTPQVAAACALWLAKYNEVLPRDWRRGAACRRVLFGGVTDRELNVEKIGVGALDAAGLFDARLTDPTIQDAQLAEPKLLHKIAPDECSWPLFRLLFGLPPPGTAVDEMFEVEAQQVAYRSTNAHLHEAMSTYRDGIGMPADVARRLRENFVNEPELSSTLRRHLKRRLAALAP